MKKTSLGNFDHVAPTGILPVRCYFCALVTPATRDRFHRGIWICADCYSTAAVKAVVGATIDEQLPKEVQ
jgi:ribosomal protein L37AE/L43A